MKNKERIVDAFKEIKVTEDLSKRIMAATIYKKEQTRFQLRSNKLRYAYIFLIILIVISSFSIVTYAIVKKYNIKKENNGSESKFTISPTKGIEINEEVSDLCKDNLKKEEAERILNIKFLSYDNEVIFNKCELERNDNNQIITISLTSDDYQDFSIENKKIVKSKEKDEWKRKYLQLHINMKTIHSENLDDASTHIYGHWINVNDKMEEYFVEPLNTEAYIYEWSDSPVCPKVLCNMVYNDILYSFYGNNISVLEMKELLNELK